MTEKPSLRLAEQQGHVKADKTKVPEIELLREYRRLQMELGKDPTSTDMERYGKYHPATYIRRYGSWTQFRKIVNNPVKIKLSREELIDNFYEVKKTLGRTPTGQELGKFGKYGVRTYQKYFGGHRRLLEYLHEQREK